MTQYRIEVSNSDGDALRTDLVTVTTSDTALQVRDLLTGGSLRDGDEITIRVGGGTRPAIIESTPDAPESLRERVAEAIAGSSPIYDPRDWADYLRDADAAIAAMTTAQTGADR